MENKLKKKSINTVIYLLLAAMLAVVVLVSFYTVAPRRRSQTDEPAATSDTARSAPPREETSSALRETETTAHSEPSTPSSVTDGTDEEKITVGVIPSEDNNAVPSSTETRYFVLPVNGAASKSFEIEIPVWSATMEDYRAHTGVDLVAPVGSEVVAASSGIVCRVWNDPMMGRSVTLDHGDGIYTTYMNLAPDPEAPEVGAGVSMGQMIGAVGESALVEIAEEPHIHLEMMIDGKYVDPLEYVTVGEYLGEFEE